MGVFMRQETTFIAKLETPLPKKNGLILYLKNVCYPQNLFNTLKCKDISIGLFITGEN